jgi:hypothetical protein
MDRSWSGVGEESDYHRQMDVDLTFRWLVSSSWCSYNIHKYNVFASEPMQQFPTVVSNTPSGQLVKHEKTLKKRRRRIILGSWLWL